MITNEYLRTMSRYNRWQNVELCAAANRVSETERREDRGVFWKSIHGTLSHLYWADRIWLSRFELTDPPDVQLSQSASFIEDWNELNKMREELDDLLVDWSDDYETGLISGNLKWFSSAIQRDAQAPFSVILTHFFNHQAHHRGQVNALITNTAGTANISDLFLMPKELWPQS